MSDTADIFKSRSIDEVYEELNAAPPQTWVDVGPGLTVKFKEDGVPVIRLHYDAIPERNSVLNPVWSASIDDRWKKYGHLSNDEWKAQNERRKFSMSGWEKEQEINAGAGGGEKLFASTISTFKKYIVITDPDWYPKPYWKVVGGFDHGKTNATTLERAYIDEYENIYMCGEFYQMRTETWANNIWQNIPELLRMPDLKKCSWIRADPSIFYDKEAQADGSYTNINAIYRKNGFSLLTQFPGEREDLTLEERVNDYWKNLPERFPLQRNERGQEIPPRGMLYIVCRNESDRRQPGLHPWDCPNLLWELKRMKRHQLTSRQLLTRNPTETIVDKDNHAFDALKYIILSLPKPADIPLTTQLDELTKGMDPTSAAITAERFVKRNGGLDKFVVSGSGMTMPSRLNRPKPKAFSMRRGGNLR